MTVLQINNCVTVAVTIEPDVWQRRIPNTLMGAIFGQMIAGTGSRGSEANSSIDLKSHFFDKCFSWTHFLLERKDLSFNRWRSLGSIWRFWPFVGQSPPWCELAWSVIDQFPGWLMTVRSPWAAPGPPCVTLLSFQSPPDPFRPALRYLATETDGQVLYLCAHTSLQKGSPLYVPFLIFMCLRSSKDSNNVYVVG